MRPFSAAFELPWQWYTSTQTCKTCEHGKDTPWKS